MSWRSPASHSEGGPQVGATQHDGLRSDSNASRRTSAARRRPGEGDAPTTTTDDSPAITFLRAAVEATATANDPAVVACRDITAAWLAGQVSGSLDAALGLAPAPGQRTLATKIATARLHDLYRQMATAHYPTETLRGRAISVHAALSDYAGRGWLHERRSPCRHPEGSLAFYLWHVMAAHRAAGRPAWPLSARHIDRLLRAAAGAASPGPA